MIQVNRYEVQLVEVFNKKGNSLGFLNEHEFNDLRCQIAEQNAIGYYLMFDGSKIEIESNGRIKNWPYDLYSINEQLLARLFKAQLMKKNIYPKIPVEEFLEAQKQLLNIPNDIQQSNQLYCSVVGAGLCPYEYENGKCNLESKCTNQITKDIK